ncbi:CD209 antigen-like protein C isoform X9 [Sebastes umbrosus]|uniref:CD209 antigen-like protein C isoform X9 n=1 Tax=Sebastes umbrosus TaxID=72105 RepID=UPI00189D7C4C|nr:CD209 antigen-like protein C isoform X9 [Sebastes umbrosus]
MELMEVDDDELHVNKNLTMGGLVTSVDFQRKKKPSRCASVCLGLLCAVLLAGNIGQFVYYEIISRFSSADPTQASYIQGGQLQSSYDALTAERKQLDARLTNLTKEKDLWQQSYSSLTTERDEFKASFNNLKNESDQLQTRYNSLEKDKERLQSSYNTLQREKEQLQTKYTSLAAARDQLQKKIDKVRAKPCQTGWSKFDISCYFVSNLEKNWTQSRQYCITMGADLVVIDSRDEQAFVNGLLDQGQNAWTGMTDSIIEGRWMWVDGTPVTTTYWGENQPNSYDGNQDCGETVQRSSGVGDWNDDGCFGDQNFICEK